MNVRLDEERLRRARRLRERGMSLSDVVREAIDARYAAVSQAESPPDVEGIIRGLFERYPDAPDAAPRGYDVHDRHAARAAIRSRLRSNRS